MERVKIEIPLVCGCILVERLDILSHDTFLRPIYGKKETVQSDATKGTQYVKLEKNPYCKDHNSPYMIKKNPSVQVVKDVLCAANLTKEDADDLYNFIQGRIRR